MVTVGVARGAAGWVGQVISLDATGREESAAVAVLFLLTTTRIRSNSAALQKFTQLMSKCTRRSSVMELPSMSDMRGGSERIIPRESLDAARSLLECVYTSHEVVNWNLIPDNGVSNSATHVKPERFAVDYCLRMFSLQNGSLIDLAYVVTLGYDQTKPT